MNQRIRARGQVGFAIRKGILVRPKACEECGATPTGALHAHHDDYYQPLAVRWLCRSCHKRLHWSEGPPNRPKPAPQQLCANCKHSVYHHWRPEQACGFYSDVRPSCDCSAYQP